MADQFILEGRDFSTDVPLGHGLNKEPPLLDAEAVHFSFGLLALAEQQPQLSQFVQVDVCAAGLSGRLDADGEQAGGGGDCVGPQVDYDGPCWVQPLQRAL